MSFVDKDDRELGSISAQSIGNWVEDFFDGVFLANFLGNRSGAVSLDKLDIIVGVVSQTTTIVDSYNSLGLTYNSGHGDYAEWLERENFDEFISRGDIVGVRAGKISKDIENAEQVLVVSEFPIMLGNAPEKDEEHKGNKVAFIGQVPVKVMGPVQQGDFILADTNVPGFGVAKSPQEITKEDLKFIVGKSWEANPNQGPKTVNTVVGVHNGEYFRILGELKNRHTESEKKLNQIEEKVLSIHEHLKTQTN